MEDRFRHRLFRLGIPVLGLTSVAILVVRGGGVRAISRSIGFWAYLATVNQAWPDTNLVQEAQRASSGVDVLVPYWGSQRWLDEESVDRELAPAIARA